jgi:hypothetical protein
VAMRNAYQRAVTGGGIRSAKGSSRRRLGEAEPSRQRWSRSVASGGG